MAFPNLKGKHAHEAMVSPEETIAYAKRKRLCPRFKPPKSVIFCYQKRLLKRILKSHRTTKSEGAFWFGELYLLDDTNGRVAVAANFGIGAPVVVTILEELIAWGVRRFVSIGTAGTLQKGLAIGDIVVCDRAIRDEGTSHHYLRPSKYSYASPAMTKTICGALEARKRKYTLGTSWTIDAPYRETVAEARHYQKEGVATVEMEASALFAVAAYRKVEMAALFTISDSLAEMEWKYDFHRRRVQKSLDIIFRTALEVLP